VSADTGVLTVRPAGVEDVEAVQSILTEACRWLASRGIVNQWPREGFPLEQTARFVAEGRMFVGEVDGEAVATIAVDTWADPEFWPDEDGEPAYYVHRLAVRRAWAGQGTGAALLDWAEQYACERGGRWLRLDVSRGNVGLHAYYSGLGFTHVGTIDLPHRISGVLFQRLVGPRSLAPGLCSPG
jgi:GNAT superfamily N-acetyltransferase